jgi:hypothetical protein
MSSTPRRSGIRLPWSSASADDAADPLATSPDPEVEASQALSADVPEPASEPATPTAFDPVPGAPSTPEPQAGASTELLRDLVAAMRRVVEASRDTSVATLRTAVDEAGASLAATTAERQASLRSRAEADISEIGAWERAEIERVRGEAVARVGARRATLDQELAEAAARSEAEHAALASRVDDYELEMSAFMAELDRIGDPAAFAATARRMPVPPAIGQPATPATASPTPAAESLTERLAELDERLAAQDAGAAPVAEGDATSIIVRGLGSFGAITTFKQALERVDGVTAVKLALGPGGEFVYSASHAPGVDMQAAVRAVEADAEITRDGSTLRVKVTRAR